jgi:MFS family permease
MLQGLGAALLPPGSLSTLRHVFTDEKEWARAVGLWSGVSAVGLAIGPVLGGRMVDAFGWASVFWINVPIGAAGLLLAARVLPEFAGRTRRVDLPGQLLSVLGFGALVYAQPLHHTGAAGDGLAGALLAAEPTARRHAMR